MLCSSQVHGRSVDDKGKVSTTDAVMLPFAPKHIRGAAPSRWAARLGLFLVIAVEIRHHTAGAAGTRPWREHSRCYPVHAKALGWSGLVGDQETRGDEGCQCYCVVGEASVIRIFPRIADLQVPRETAGSGRGER